MKKRYIQLKVPIEWVQNELQKALSSKEKGSYNLGFLGEEVVMAKLRGENITVLRLDPDCEYDLFLPVKGLRIEVKTCYKAYSKCKGSSTACYPLRIRDPLNFEYAICWAINDDAFYIIPAPELKAGVNRIYPQAARWRIYSGNWDQLK